MNEVKAVSGPALESTGFSSRCLPTLLFAAMTALLIAACDSSEQQGRNKAPASPDVVTIGSTNYAGTALVHLAQSKGYFADEGLQLTIQQYSTGKAALEAALTGKVDVATVADLPIALAALNKRPAVVLATISTGGSDYAVIGRKDRGVTGPETLKGKKIAVTSETSGDFFLDTFLVRHRLKRDDVKTLSRKPEEMAEALASGEVDAVSTWEPHVAEATQIVPGEASVFAGNGIYEATFNLASSREFADKRGNTIRKLLRALLRAEMLLAGQSAEAQAILANAFVKSPSEARQLLSKHRFVLQLDQSLLGMLEDQSRWAVKRKLVAADGMPNFLNHLYLTGLQDVKPKAVTVIR